MRRLLPIFGLIFCLMSPSSAQQAELQSARAWAPTKTIKPICIDVTVRNRGDKTAKNGVAKLLLTPEFRSNNKSTPGMMEPRELEQSVPPIPPGQAVTVTFETPFFARSAFSSTNGLFRVENLIPGICQWTTVTYQVFLVGPPGEFCISEQK